MKFLDFMRESPSGVKCRHAQNEWAVIHRLESGFKGSQGSETLIGTGVNYLLGQVTNQSGRAFPLVSKAGLYREANPRREQTLLTEGNRA